MTLAKLHYTLSMAGLACQDLQWHNSIFTIQLLNFTGLVIFDHPIVIQTGI